MTRKAGQPPKPSFEKIKTLYWYKTVEGIITNELIEECKEDIRQTEMTKTLAAKTKKSELRKLNNKLERLSGKGNYKKYGPQFSEITEHLICAEDNFKKGLLSGVVSTKVWGRYASGQYTPSRILDVLDIFYPGTKAEYEDGPFKIFKIMQSNFLIDAVNTFTKEFVSYICPEGKEFHDGSYGTIQRYLDHFSKEWEKPFNFEDVISKLKKFDNILNSLRGEVYAEDFEEFGHCAYLNTMDQMIPPYALACLYLSLGFIQYKFFGDHRLFMYTICRMDALTEIELEYRIPRLLWFEDESARSNDALDVFARVRNMEHFFLPDESTPTHRTFPKLIKSKSYRTRFSGRKMV